MVEEKPLGKIFKIKRDETGKSEVLKSALKKPKTENTESKEKGILVRKDKDKALYEGKETLNSSSKELGRSIIREPVGSTGKETLKSSSKDPLKLGSKDSSKHGSKDPVRSSVKEEPGKTPVKEPIRSIGRDLLKVSKELGKGSGNANANANGNGKEHHGKVVKKEEKSIAQELGLTNGKEAGKLKDSFKVKEERDKGREKDKTKDERDKVREKDKGKAPLSKPSTPGSASKVKPSITNNRGGTSSEKQAVKKVTITTTTKTKTTTTKTVKEEKKGKKVYSLPGQKHEPPEERDPLRVFYSTLREQVPDSEMAEVWLMEHGLLAHNEAKHAFDRKQKRVHGLKHSTPMKSSPSSQMSNGSTGARTPASNGKGKGAGTSKSKKRVDNYSDSDSDDDFLQNRLKKKLKA